MDIFTYTVTIVNVLIGDCVIFYISYIVLACQWLVGRLCSPCLIALVVACLYLFERFNSLLMLVTMLVLVCYATVVAF